MNTDRGGATPLINFKSAHERSTVCSSLWAAAGDALGWITELTHGTRGLIRRAGVSRIIEPVSWKRVIGGRSGPTVLLPPGTYSDDTQLRLAVSRSIRGDGSFDVEAFAKVEIAVWPSYALGAGIGSTAAAVNLSRRRTTWFSNFYVTEKTRYVDSGGNGAAMRIQPHVWSTPSGANRLLRSVLRDALVTHGHVHAFCGAIFHALCLDSAIRSCDVPRPADWAKYIDRFQEVPSLIADDPELSAFWLPGWEAAAGVTISEATSRLRDEARRDADTVASLVDTSDLNSYSQALNQIGCLTSEFRGSGFKTALAAAALAQFYDNFELEECLEAAANELDSDTDTIATMAGALLGAVSRSIPSWPIQDREYITQEAVRLSAIACGQIRDSFSYPDVGHWIPPSRTGEPIGWLDDRMAIAGLGDLTPLGTQYSTNKHVWEWCALSFGQTILARRRTDSRSRIVLAQLPGPRQEPRTEQGDYNDTDETLQQPTLPLKDPQSRESSAQGNRPKFAKHQADSVAGTIDSWSDEAIASDFDDKTLGRLLNQCIDQSQSVETTVGFAAIVAKAKLARQRRRT